MTQIDLNRMDPDQLRLLRDALTGEVAAARPAIASAGEADANLENAGCDDGDPWAGLREMETRLRLVIDEIWRREDARVDVQILAAYATTHVSWSEVDEEWPLARSTWDREIGPTGDGLHLIVHAGPPRQTSRGAPLEGRWLMAFDESHGCRLQGPLDKGMHPSGCHCRLWNNGTRHWVDLAREGLSFGIDPGVEVEGVLLGKGPDAVFLQRVSTLDASQPTQQILVETWLVQPAGRLPLRLLTSAQLDVVLPGLIDQTIRLARLPDLVIRGGFRAAQYAIRPVLLTSPALGSLSSRELGMLSRASDWLREDWSSAIADGLRWIGADNRRPPGVPRQDAVMRLTELAQHAHGLLQLEVATAIANLRDAVSARSE